MSTCIDVNNAVVLTDFFFKFQKSSNEKERKSLNCCPDVYKYSLSEEETKCHMTSKISHDASLKPLKTEVLRKLIHIDTLSVLVCTNHETIISLTIYGHIYTVTLYRKLQTGKLQSTLLHCASDRQQGCSINGHTLRVLLF